MDNSPTVLEIDSEAIYHNLKYFKSILNKKTKLLVVIKAFAYGSDPVEIAQILEKKNIDYLAVAYAKEGVAIRKAGILMPILILFPQKENFETIISYNLEPNLYSLEVLNEFINHLNGKQLNNYPIHFKINSGMNRVGFRQEDIKQLKQTLKNTNSVKVVSIYSHFASSDDIREREFSFEQIAKYIEIYNDLITVLPNKPLKHISNTSGIINLPEAQFDMVRLGIGFYGFGNDIDATKKLKNVCNLKTKIFQIHTIEPGETVSYNRNFKPTKTSKIGVIPLGYADGIHRILSRSKVFVNINNQKAPIVGNICMDTLLIDITDIDCKVGDEVIVFNSQEHILDFAEKANTIPYEILTSISQRVRRKIL